MNTKTAERTALPITIRGVTKTYGDVYALDDVDLDVRSGEFITLLGPSGSGKTTLLMVLSGFNRPDCGSVRFGDTEVIRLSPHKRDVGMVFQNYALFPHMDVNSNLAFPLKLRKVGKAEIADRVKKALELVQLVGLGERRISQLSGGQRQRVALARAIIFEPRILLMDEPLSALDKNLREHMQIELRRLHEMLGMTTVYVTHDQREALTMSDRVVVVNHGKLMQIDEPKQLYERPRSKFVAAFIGESTFLPVTVEGGRAAINGRPLSLAEAPLNNAADQFLLLRPEKLEILTNGQTGSHNCFTGKVKDLVYQGESFLLYIDLDDGPEATLRSPTRREVLDAVPEMGGEITIGLHPEDTIIVSADDS